MRIPARALVLAAVAALATPAHAEPLDLGCTGSQRQGYFYIVVDVPPSGPESVHVTCFGNHGPKVCDVLDG